MSTIRILPLDAEITAGPGATIMGAARALGFYWPTTCGGEGRCTTCACEIVEGGDALVPMGRSERAVLVEERGSAVLATPLRLACQARVEGGGAMIVVRKNGVLPPQNGSREQGVR